MNESHFVLKVTSVVKQIPRGSTLSYKAVASAAGYPGAHRAVARVMAQNYDKTIPCHRVIRNDGTVGGYNRGGTSQKRSLLIKEGAIIC
jgi:O-6-methylguanine DNA methyltransferase